MKTEHYLKAVSRAIERCQQETDQTFEEYASLLMTLEDVQPELFAQYDAIFTAQIARSYLAMQDTITNLRKWPRQ